MSNDPSADTTVYSPVARRFHWWTAALVLFMIPLGYIMTDDANPFGISEATGARLNSIHKLIGFTILWLVIARLFYRFRHGAPASEPSLEPWQKGAAHATHWLLYFLLVAVPFAGWFGASLYGDLGIFGLVNLPALAKVDQKASEPVFQIHQYGAYAILALVVAHVGAALYHHLIRGDGVLRRMLPGVAPRG